jgi:hypothetical protein
MRHPLKSPKRLFQKRELYSPLISLVVLCREFSSEPSTSTRDDGSALVTGYTFGRKTTLVDNEWCWASTLTQQHGLANKWGICRYCGSGNSLCLSGGLGIGMEKIMTRTARTVLAAALLLGGATIAMAQNGPPTGGYPPARWNPNLYGYGYHGYYSYYARPYYRHHYRHHYYR